MENKQKVLIYGNSLLLAGIQAGLRADPGFEVIVLGEQATEAELLAPDSHVMIYDMGSFQPEYFLAQVQSRPGLLLIGVNAESHEVLLTGQAAGSITLDQITQIVQRVQVSDSIIADRTPYPTHKIQQINRIENGRNV